MKWEELLKIVGDEPVFSSALLMSGTVSVENTRHQLSRWVRSGKITPLRKGRYILADPYRKIDPHPFLLANAMKTASYVSLQSGLAYYGMIPEYTPVVTSVTTGRPELIDTALGVFAFSHVKRSWFTGYRKVEVAPGQAVFLAGPEKCLLDLIYLTPRAHNMKYLRELRLQNLDRLKMGVLKQISRSAASPKLIRAARYLEKLALEEEHDE
jgi:predicted transcriptional regulator of viral defense system